MHLGCIHTCELYLHNEIPVRKARAGCAVAKVTALLIDVDLRFIFNGESGGNV